MRWDFQASDEDRTHCGHDLASRVRTVVSMTSSPDLTGLRGTVHGDVLTPDECGYDTLRTGYQLHVTHRPDVLVAARTASDVQAAVRFAAANALEVAVLGTGHGTPVGGPGGLLVETAGLDHLAIDTEQRTARIGAGVRWSRVLAEAAPHGLTALAGSAPEVNAVAYTLGGGVSLLGRTFGFAADHVRRLDVVTADGALRIVDADADPDLFWALRGGGGAYGIVTAIVIDLMPISSVYGGGLIVDSEHVPAMLRAWRDWTADVPESVTSAVTLVPFPDADALPPFLRGRHVASVWAAVVGSEEEGIELVQPLRDAVPVLADTVEMRRTADLGTITNDPTDPAAFTSRGTTLTSLDDQAIDALLAQAGPGVPGAGIVEVRHLGGAMARPQGAPNAVGHRDADYSLSVLSVLHGEARADQAAAWQRATLDALEPWSGGGALLNLMGGARGTADGVRTAFEGEIRRRLARVKAIYDPRNLFCRDTAISAATAGADPARSVAV